MAKRGCRRVSEGQDGRSERPARWHEQRPDASQSTPSRMRGPAAVGNLGFPTSHQRQRRPWMAPAPPIRDTEQDARTGGRRKPWLSDQPPKAAEAMAGSGTTNPRHRAGCEDRRPSETLAFRPAAKGGGGQGWPRRRTARTPEMDAPQRPCQPAFRRRLACPAWR